MQRVRQSSFSPEKGNSGSILEALWPPHGSLAQEVMTLSRRILSIRGQSDAAQP